MANEDSHDRVNDQSPDQPCYEEPTSPQRRTFFRKLGRVAVGIPLTHFTILGALGGSPRSAEASFEIQQGCQCTPDPSVQDTCAGHCGTEAADWCKPLVPWEPQDWCDGSVPDQNIDCCPCPPEGSSADACECPPESDPADACKCASDTAGMDVCLCDQEGQTVDWCTCSAEGQGVDACNCGTDQGQADYCQCFPESEGSDVCACPAEQGRADYCLCMADAGTYDVCDCGREQAGGADYCKCGGEAQAVDSCAESPTCFDYHDDDYGGDYCTCGTDGQAADACKCWHDGVKYPGPEPEPEGEVSDICTSPKDASGEVDCCACCAEHNQNHDNGIADTCDCGGEKGSYCYEEGGMPKMADWCNTNGCVEGKTPPCTQDAFGADICTCPANDANTSENPLENNQADICYYDDPTGPPGPSQPGAGDLCECAADQANGPGATDYCQAGGDQTCDYCTCTPEQDANNQADV